jgi:hypothetical protein
MIQLGKVAQPCNPSYLGGRDREDNGSSPEGVMCRGSSEDPSQPMLAWCCVPLIPAIQGSTNSIAAQAGLGLKWDPSSKIIHAKRAGGMVQVIDRS